MVYNELTNKKIQKLYKRKIINFTLKPVPIPLKTLKHRHKTFYNYLMHISLYLKMLTKERSSIILYGNRYIKNFFKQKLIRY